MLFDATQLGFSGYTHLFSPDIRKQIAEEFLKNNGCKASSSQPFGPQYCQSEMDAALRAADPGGHFDGVITLPHFARRGGANPFAPFAHAALVGDVRGGFVSDSSNLIGVHGLLVMKTGRNALCLSFSGVGKEPFTAQNVQGRFTTLGGTGTGAKIHASGAFLSIEPSGVSDATKPFDMYVWLLPKKLTVGTARGMPARCRAATRPPVTPPGPPPPPTSASASFDGFAFLPANANALPAGTTLYPNGSTVTGATACGTDNNLYAVVTYSGPNTTTQAALFGPNGTISVNDPVNRYKTPCCSSPHRPTAPTQSSLRSTSATAQRSTSPSPSPSRGAADTAGGRDFGAYRRLTFRSSSLPWIVSPVGVHGSSWSISAGSSAPPPRR